MSFILDALKKSESERQRQSGPALFEVKVAPPRHRFAIWAIGLGSLLAINLIVVVWLLSRGSFTRRVAPPTAAVQRLPTPTPAQPPVASLPAPAGAASIQSARAPAAASPATDATQPRDSARAEAVTPNPEDLAPAVEPPKGSSVPDGGGAVVRATESGLPTYQDAAAVPGANLPALQLNLHVYSPKPDESFVFLNMTKLHEGDSLPQGVHVDAITPDGVILSYHGTRFVLQRP